ncbi:MAG: S24/S26 family peptidase [Clostridia bacterium]|nr:S24/S26 family peptidase [Clostridia bacterium]
MKNEKVEKLSSSGRKGPLQVLPTETYFALVREKLAENGQAYVRVTGTSMQPLLRHLRDGVIIEPPGRIRPGDIVLFDRRNGRYALHRVIRIQGDRFTMAGDNQWYLDRDLPLNQVVGVVRWVDRGGRKISCEKFFMKMYARVVTALSVPRINIRRAVGWLVKPFRRAGSDHRKGERG